MFEFKMKISGAEPSNNFRDVISPYDGRIVGRIEVPDDNAIEKAVANAKFNFDNVMKQMPAYQRAEILYNVAQLIQSNHEELAHLIAAEGGKPVKDARIEVSRAANTVKMSADEALNLNGDQLTMDRAKGSEDHIAFTIKQALGPVLAISAFNHPVNLICHQVATAFAAGNTLIVKPASTTPLSCLTICDYFTKAGLPDGIINVLPVAGSKIEKVISDPRIRFVTFIGSAEIGWAIPKLVAPGVGYALEHGGTAVAVIDKSADLTRAIPGIIKGGFYHAGQVCVSTQNVFIHREIYENVKELLIKATSNLITGDPNHDLTDVGPIITEAELTRVLDWIEAAKSMGAKVLLGSNRIGKNCIEPTIIENTNYDMKIMSSEVFGPVININTFDDISEIIAQCNQTPFSFQNAIYTQDIDMAMNYAILIDSKAVIINDSTAFRVDWMPFGGAKESGFKVGGIKYSINDLVEEKLIIIKRKPL
ncbi:MAG: aldehyde dehydrogenase family protein [Candidatus Kapabacteria bacterium]|nr:aldehyde dehydrogenase family protein [Candidatus Kapabacteria bacterium]